MSTLDATDKKLLGLIQRDCKQTTKALSLQLDLSVTAVYERIKKLESAGIITDYIALVSKEKTDKNFVAYAHIKLKQHTQENVVEFETKAVQLEDVLECYHISGEFDFLLKVVFKDMKAYREFMVEKLTRLDQIGSSHSMFVIKEVKQTYAIKVD